MDEDKYIKGFNQGYALSQHDAELAASIAASVKDRSESIWQGFVAGGKEFAMEMKGKNKDRFLGMHQNYKVSDKGLGADNTKNKAKGKEDLERE